MEHIVETIHRPQAGRGVARLLRRQGRVPGVIYGGAEVINFSCDANKLAVFLKDEGFRSSVVSLRLDGKEHRALLREVQRHPARRDILHVDFQAVRADREITAQVPIHFINAELSPGVKLHQGIFTGIENQVTVHCLPQDLPEYLEVDVGELDIAKSIHLSEIVPPPGVRFGDIVRGNDPALATISSVSAEEPETAPEDAVAEDPAAPVGDAA